MKVWAVMDVKFSCVHGEGDKSPYFLILLHCLFFYLAKGNRAMLNIFAAIIGWPLEEGEVKGGVDKALEAGVEGRFPSSKRLRPNSIMPFALSPHCKAS